MHCVVWTYIAPPSLDEPTIRRQFDAVADRYIGIPGLIRKYFGLSDDGKSVVGIYLWTSKDAADAFYSPEWIAGVTERWGATPQRVDWIVPVVAESAGQRVVRDLALSSLHEHQLPDRSR
jgi:hypothetical protein